MIRRGWIEATENTKSLEAQLKRFFDTEDIEQIADLPLAARKSIGDESTSVPLRAWNFRARRLSRTVHAEVFDHEKFVREFPNLRDLTPHPENIRRLPSILASWGIRLLVVSHLEHTKLDGAALWVDGNPVVVITLRFDRIDYFWHTLIHELVHIKYREGSVDSDMLSDAKGEGGMGAISETEERANSEATEILVPQDKLRSFIIRTAPLYSEQKIVRFGQANGVHPGIVLGQLHHRYRKSTSEGIHWKNLRALLVPVRHLIVGVAMTDGWGNQPGSF
jgi:HTH-type transcriptional regulator / antitoxin HigA